MSGMIIIGGGECGVRAAFALREHGYDGEVTLIGDEPHLPYERPPLSKDLMTCADAPVARTIAAAERFADQRITFLGGSRVDEIDPAGKTVHTADGRRIAYDKLLIATGSTPRRLPMADGLAHIAYLRSFDDTLAIRSRLGPGSKLAVIGGGFIGLELAASARKLGAEVVVIEAQPRVLMRGVPAEIAETVQALHRANGVEIRCGTAIEGLEHRPDTVGVRLADGSEFEADLAVIGIGALPMTALAEKAGLTINNGIAVDEYLRTSELHIFAAGDCCSFPVAAYGGRRIRLEAWRNAQEQGTLAARNMLGHDIAHEAVPWFWSDQYEMSLQIAGLPDEGASTVRRDLDGGAFILFHLSADGRLVAASGYGHGNSVAREIRLAEMLIARGVRPDAGQLASPETKLKSLLAA